MNENGEWIPLWSDEPTAVLHEAVNGDVKATTFGHAVTIKIGKTTVPFNLVNSADPEADSFNIGTFIALRDHTSKSGNVIVGGQDYRHFAYN